MAEFKLPEVGEGIDSGLVVSVLVKVGERIEVDQAVLELETDKAVVEVPSSIAGVIQAINVKENEEAKVGQIILSVAETATTNTASAEPAPTAQPETPAESSTKLSNAATTLEFILPELGEGIDAGTVVGILVNVGDSISVDQSVIELETDKAVVEVPSSVAGVVESIAVKANEEAKVGQVVLTVTAASGAPAVKEAAKKAVTMSDTHKEAPPTPVAATAPAMTTPSDDNRLIPAAPSVRRLAREMGVNVAQVAGSGVLGRISAQDVRAFAMGGAAPAEHQATMSTSTAAPLSLPDFNKWGDTERVPMSGIRKATVRAMTQAWATVPMVTQFDKADSTDFEALRQRYKARAKEEGASLTPTAMLLKVMAAALKKFPDFNASIDTETNEVIYKSYINIGVAVDTPNGLLVPVLKNADQKGIITLAKELGDLAAKARDRKLSPDDMQGGNFNISNLGGIGGTGFTPIVNPPQVAILGVSRGSYEPVWDADKAEFVPKLMMPLCVTYDHRLIDGAAAAKFLRWVCGAIEEPFLMALEG